MHTYVTTSVTCHRTVSVMKSGPFLPHEESSVRSQRDKADSVTFRRGPSCPGAQTRVNVTIFISPCIDLTLGCSNGHRTPLCPL